MPDEPNGLIIKIKIAGPAFENDNAVLHPTLTVLSGYEEAIARCLQGAATADGFPKDLQFSSSIKLRRIESGCLEIQTYLDLAAALMPFGMPMLSLAVKLTPEVLKRGWELFIAAYKVISIAVKHFAEKGKHIKIIVENSPGAIVQIVNGADGTVSQIAVSPDVLKVAKEIYSNMEMIADTVVKGEAKEISIQAEYDGAEPCVVNKENGGYFKQVTRERTEEEVVQLNAHMYRLNTKSKKGMLEIVGDPAKRTIPFSVESGDMEEYVDTLKVPEATFMVKREFSVNALGETKISRLVLVGIAR